MKGTQKLKLKKTQKVETPQNGDCLFNRFVFIIDQIINELIGIVRLIDDRDMNAVELFFSSSKKVKNAIKTMVVLLSFWSERPKLFLFLRPLGTHTCERGTRVFLQQTNCLL